MRTAWELPLRNSLVVAMISQDVRVHPRRRGKLSRRFPGAGHCPAVLPPGVRRWHPGSNGMGPLIAWRHDLQLLVYVRGVQIVSALGREARMFGL